MPEYRLSEKVSYDLDDIADYTYEAFGDNQADKYGHELLRAFDLLAVRPHMGRMADGLASGLRAFPFEAHVIYYSLIENGIVIVRILHHSMDARRHV